MQQPLSACACPTHLLLFAKAPIDELIDGRFDMRR
jgi:hypothetical protein